MRGQGSDRRRVPGVTAAELVAPALQEGDDPPEEVVQEDRAFLRQERRHAEDRHSAWATWVARRAEIHDEYVPKVWKWSVRYILAALVLVILDAIERPPWLDWTGVGFDIDTPIVVTLIGSTAATVVGCLYIILRHHFPEDGNSL